MRKLILAFTTTIAVLAPVLILTAGASATTGTESFSLIDATTSQTPVFSVIATGAFLAGGTATRPSKGVLKLRFPDGTITLHTTGHKVSSMHQTATACIETQTNTGDVPLHDRRRDRRLQGITGSGRGTAHNTFVEQVVQACPLMSKLGSAPRQIRRCCF